MKSTTHTSSDGNFPYGDQPNYRDFLLWEEVLKSFAEHEEANMTASNPMVIARYFHPSSSMTWYATEYNVDEEVFYGYVTGFQFPEWGSFSLREFIELQLPYGLKIERDLWFTPKPIKQALKDDGQEL